MQKTIKKSVSMLLAVLLVFSLFTIVPFTAGAAEITGMAIASQLQVGDILGTGVSLYEAFGYTTILEANRHGNDEDIITVNTELPSGLYSMLIGSDGFMINDGMTDYYPYDQNGNQCDAFIVTAVNTASKTVTLAGYSESDGVPVPTGSVSYRYYTGVGFRTGNTPADKTYKVVSNNREWADGSWYVVTENVTIDKRIIITGTVNLVLCDGAKLIAKQGISVNGLNRYGFSGGNVLSALNIYAQSGGTGTLFAGTTDGISSILPYNPDDAAIGGDHEFRNGDIAIHGGNITALSNYGAAGIGSGQYCDGGNVDIYGGNIIAGVTQGAGSGIGGGYRTNSGRIRILGGVVTATGYDGTWYSAGIGCEDTVFSVDLTVADGAIFKAGDSPYAAVDVTVEEYNADRKEYVYINAGVLPDSYDITWKNGDEVLATDEVAGGETPAYQGETPTKPEDANNTYTFSDWSDGSNTYAADALPAVYGDVTYTAQYTATAKTFKAYAKKLTGETYTIENLTDETTVAQLKEIIADQIDIPATAQRLIFAGKQLEDAKTLAEYNIKEESTFHLIIRGYTVTWLNYDNSELGTTTVQYGATPSYDGETPTKPEDETNTYTFAGWTPALAPATDNASYKAEFTASPKTTKLIAGHTLSLDGNIGINFYLDPAAAGMTAADVTAADLDYSFAWADGNALVDVASQAANKTFRISKDGKYIIVSCKVCAAEMTCGVNANFTLGDKSESEVYSVREYCDTVLSDDTQPEKLVDLVVKMLDYGAKAQTVFGIKTDDLANDGLDYVMQDVTTEMFDTAILTANDRAADDIAANAPAGAGFKTSSLVFLSESTLRLYFAKENDSFNTSGMTKWNDYYYTQVVDIPAAQLDTLQQFNVSGTTLCCSALNYAKALAAAGNADNAALAKALYWYNQAAKRRFAS